MKKVFLIILAILITVSAAFYQRITGPTYPKDFEFNHAGDSYKFELIRSHAGEKKCEIILPLPDKFEAEIHYKKFPTSDPFVDKEFSRSGETLTADLPHQPHAGKLAYYVTISSDGKEVFSTRDKTVQIRFRGDVPAWAMLPHIIFVFFGMLFANITGLFAVFNIRFKSPLVIAFFLLLAGGMIFGPIVQKFAFGEYWAGVPFGWDLTDNKMLIGFLAWTVALFANMKRERRIPVIIAAFVILVIFSIPHSMYGSEYNYETGKIIQG